MIEASKFQKSVIEQIEKIGDAITLIEGICKDIEELDPILVNDIGEGFYSAQPITKFIINHRKYTLWYNEMRDLLFKELSGKAYIEKNKF
ncbi:hypothetical protein LCGC14_2846190 [marine sediment metagenome]|uniref:Uncharacterized protein n=1 Tax=marine sediment metagenome TaxID=412755 RepID=A0A0F9AI39_9ZZZZ